jgi:hypothetical protein
MDTLTRYRDAIQALLQAYAALSDPNGSVQDETVFDREADRYLLMAVGWQGPRRIHQCVLHLDLVAGEVWVQANHTDQGIVAELVAAGIAPNDIVLAFHPPEARALVAHAMG